MAENGTRTARATVRRRRSRIAAALTIAVALAASLVVLPSALAQSSSFAIEIRPENRQDSAVAYGRRISISGKAPQGSITAARLIAVEEDGTRRSDPVADAYLNTVNPRTDYLANVAGELTGRLTPACLFAPPTPGCPHGETRTVLLEITVAGQTGQSNQLRVDYVRPEPYSRPELQGVHENQWPPQYRVAKLLDRDRIEVRFTEPVRFPEEASVAEWVVTNPPATVLSVEGPREGDCVGFYPPGADSTAGPTGCTRTLVITPVDEDAQPKVEYVHGATSDRETRIKDFASNDILNMLNHVRTAIDLIRPPTPRIETVGGQPVPESERVVSNQRRVRLEVSNVRPGQRVFVQALVDGAVVREGPKVAVSTGQTQGGADIELPADGVYTLRAVVEDPNGNRSTDASKGIASGREDSEPSSVVYALDSVAPVITSAVRTGARTVQVTFFDATSTAVLPAGDAGQWRINGAALASVSGDGLARTLTATADFGTAEQVVTWRRTGDTGTGTYRDEAGNLLVEETAGIVVAALPPLPNPVVTQPAPGSTLFTSNPQVEIRGTVAAQRPNLVAEIYTRGDTPGQSAPRASRAVTNGSWAVPVDLGSDARHRLDVVIRDSVTGVTSAAVPISDIVVDTSPPTVDVTAPATRDLEIGASLDRRPRYALGDPVPVRWTSTDEAADDLQPDHTAGSRISLVPAEGQPRLLATRFHGNGSQGYDHTLTEQDFAGAEEREVRFRVETFDAVALTGDDLSDPALLTVNIIGHTPVFVSNLAEASVIEVRFPVALQGSTSQADWRVDNVPPRLVQMSADRRTITLTAMQPITDPNARPQVLYRPSAAALAPLRAEDGRPVVEEPRTALDGIAPALSVNAPSATPRNAGTAGTIEVTGLTDSSKSPNEILAFRAAPDGSPTDEVLASTKAKADDPAFRLVIPIARNAATPIAIVASDGQNTSPVRSFTVVEDSTPPVVAITGPAANSRVGSTVTLTWKTADSHRRSVNIDYRLRGEGYQPISHGEPDDGLFEWELPEGIEDRALLDLRVTAVDAARNEGAATVPGLLVDRIAPVVKGAKSTSERTVDVFFSEPVVAGPAASGFALPGGPAVTSASAKGDTVTLRLATDLSTTEPEVTYGGKAVKDLAGNPAEAASLRAQRGFAFAVTGLGGAADRRTRTVRLSWVDDRNRAEHLARYEIRANGAPAGTVPPSARTFAQPDVRSATTYEVVAVDDLGNRSRPATTVVDPDLPNITPAGGFVLSDDGQVALIVPPRAVSQDYWGRLTMRTPQRVPGYRPLGAAYELVAEPAGEGTPLTAFSRFACLSFRPEGGLPGSERARVSVLRRTGVGADEVATRVGTGSAEACLLAVGTFTLGEAEGATVRVSGTDPSLPRDRFATAAALAQTTYARADTAVLARGDDYPDALAAAALAKASGGPVLLATSDVLPQATALELLRLGVSKVLLSGGPAAVSEAVAEAVRALGITVERVAGPTRYETAVAIAARLGGADRAYLATGLQFADALAAAAPSAYFEQPILLTDKESLTPATLVGLHALGIAHVDLLGGAAAISPAVEEKLVAEGFTVRRIAGRDRYETALAVARAAAEAGLPVLRPVAASGQGDGRTSPDALAAGPVAAREGAPLVLVPADQLHPAVADYLRAQDSIRGVVVAGGPAAVSPATRSGIDAARR